MYGTVPSAAPGPVRSNSSMVGAERGHRRQCHRASWSRQLCQPKVQYFDVAAPGYEQIRGLDVAMNDAFGMGGIQCVRNINGDGDYAFQIQRMGGDQIFQRRAIQDTPLR